MQKTDVKTGFRCNNRCVFCVQGDKRSIHGDKSTEEVKAILDEARQVADELVLTGGEVTIRPDIVELTAYAKSLDFRVIQIQTNGRMFSSMDFAQAMWDAGATELSPAIHGANPETHDEQTRAPGSFRQTVRGIRNARKLGMPIVLNSVITLANYRQLPDMARLFVRLDVQQFQFAFVHALGTASENFDAVVPRYRDIQPFVLGGLRVGLGAGVRCMTEAIPLCCLPDLEHLAAEHIIPRTRIFDANFTVEDYTEFRLTEGKAKGPPCEGCTRSAECEGPWREYPEHFGWDEFRAFL